MALGFLVEWYTIGIPETWLPKTYRIPHGVGTRYNLYRQDEGGDTFRNAMALLI